MFVAFRAITFSTLFVALLLVYLPARVLARSGITRPESFGSAQVVGIIVTALGTAIALWCIVTFISIGKGTPAPFDPPRRLVVRGPYQFVRNPMYIGAVVALSGAALFYRSIALLLYGVGFLAISHVFVVLYEEPALQRTFGNDYDDYRRHVHRWWPRLHLS
ncbi:MAG TPA: isoprenylcysteine carboxylmethyltransferase family protein [Terriglobales bacterium]